MGKRIVRYSLLSLSMLTFAGCAGVETNFENSPYGKNVESMIGACIDLQQNGLLPGIGAGQASQIASEQALYSERNNVNYPLELVCIVTANDDQKYYFPFVKASPDSDWQLIE